MTVEIGNIAAAVPGQKDNYPIAREILATVALYRCGDTPDGLARRKLEQFEVGPSGPWAELAAQVLKTPPGKAPEAAGAK